MDINNTVISIVDDLSINVITIKSLLLNISEDKYGKIFINFSEKRNKIKNFSETLVINFDIIKEKI